MRIFEFNQLTEQLDRMESDMIERAEPGTPGLLLDYENNQGQRNQFKVINISSSPYNGCFEADCLSDYRQTELEDRFGIYDSDLAVSSHRTFKIANIITAKIIVT